MGVFLSEQERFAALFDEHAPTVFAYAVRQVPHADAQDVVADTFLVAWRRLDDVPDRALPWLLVVARNTISQRRRRDRRQDHVANASAVLERLAGPASAAESGVVERQTLLDALAAMSEIEREALLLVAWTDLTRGEAAKVVGCSTRAFEVRLSRARARLSRALNGVPDLAAVPQIRKDAS